MIAVLTEALSTNGYLRRWTLLLDLRLFWLHKSLTHDPIPQSESQVGVPTLADSGTASRKKTPWPGGSS